MQYLEKIKNMITSVYHLHIMAGPHINILYFSAFVSFLNVLIEGLITFGLISVASSFFEVSVLPEIFQSFLFLINIDQIKSSVEDGLLVAIYLFIALILRSLFTFISSYLSIIAKNKILSHIRTNVIKKALSIDFQDFSYIKSGSLEQIISAESKHVTNSFVNFVLSLNIIFYGLLLITLIYLVNPLLTITILPFLLFFIPFKYLYSKFIRIISGQAISLNFKLMEKLNQILTTIKEIRINNTIKKNLNSIKNKAESNANKNIFYQSLVALEPTLIQLISVLIFGIIYYFSLAFDFFSNSALIALIFILYRTTPYIVKASKNFNQFILYLPGTERVYSIYALEANNREDHNAEKIDITNIKYKNITFSYNNRDLILDGINLEFNQGETIFIDGKSGSGKSTILNLLISLYSPVSGSILINGKDYKNYHLNVLINSISFVPQKMKLPNISILNILRTSNYDLDEKQAYELLELVEMKDIVINLPNGINTIIGQKGIDFSGGQMQRLALASSLGSGKSCYIFDEATSEIDIDLEERINRNIRKFLKNKIIIFTSHRRDNLAEYDKSFSIEDGKITN